MGTNHNNKKITGLINISFTALIIFSVCFLIKDGIYSTYPSAFSGGYYINFLLYQLIFIICFNLLLKRFGTLTAIWLAFCCAIASHGLFEVVSFIDAMVLRYFVLSEVSEASVKGLDVVGILGKVYQNFFRLFRVAWYISALLPLYIFHVGLRKKESDEFPFTIESAFKKLYAYPNPIHYMLIFIIFFGAINIQMILTGDGSNFLDERFWVVFTMKSLFGSIFIYLSYWWIK